MSKHIYFDDSNTVPEKSKSRKSKQINEGLKDIAAAELKQEEVHREDSVEWRAKLERRRLRKECKLQEVQLEEQNAVAREVREGGLAAVDHQKAIARAARKEQKRSSKKHREQLLQLEQLEQPQRQQQQHESSLAVEDGAADAFKSTKQHKKNRPQRSNGKLRRKRNVHVPNVTNQFTNQLHFNSVRKHR